MRVKRVKHCKKYLSFYKTTYGFREPFHILVDMTFCQFALMCKINITEQMTNYIGTQAELFTTKCILEEGELLGPRLHGALLICRQFKLRKCKHQGALTSQQCIEAMIGTSNTDHFFVASQDHEMQMRFRKIAGVPILRIHYHALVLEKPTFHSKKQADMIGSSKSAISIEEKEKINEMKESQGIKEEKEKLPKRKKVKGVNPLAMKRKKKKLAPVGKKTKDNSKVRRRKKKKIAQHVIEELKKIPST